MKAIADTPLRNPMTMSRIPQSARKRKRGKELCANADTIYCSRKASQIYAALTPNRHHAYTKTSEDRKGPWKIHFMRKAQFTRYCKFRIHS